MKWQKIEAEWEEMGETYDPICVPGPVNLGGELTVRHSALLVVDDAHSCCYNLWWQLLRTTDDTIKDEAHFLVLYSSISMHLPPSSGSFESLDRSALPDSGRTSLFLSTRSSSRWSGVLVLFLSSVKCSSYVVEEYTYPQDRQSLPFRTKPAQYGHTTKASRV